ncbi:uncharacterized protein [Rutidosis leptorrhynchoides]|uniref:uncharacterized protein n=1 Tax=Rutidosis leptorrhynchoides TaxID=125765 RepID=UPI003A9A4AE6
MVDRASRASCASGIQNSLSQPAVQGTSLENLFTLITGNKAKRPVETSATSQKLCERIASCTLPANIVIPVTLGVYNGTTDPDDFLQIFEGAMKTQHWNDEVACHLFLTVLQSTAREWFAKLPPNGITYFADLREKFLMQYQNLCQHTYTHLYAHEIPMYWGEKIKSFITSHRHDKGSRKSYDKGSLIDSHSKTPREILLTEPVKAKFTPSAPLEKCDGQKSDKYCEFHEDNGHDIDECKALIREIIAKIKAGELNHLLSGRKFKKADPNKTFNWQKEDGKKREKVKDKVIINMINVQKDEFASQNSWKDATITFPIIPTWYSWNETVVIIGLIDGFSVTEMYTDTGSEVEVLYAHYLSRLPKCVGRKMRQSNAIISGFSGHAKETVGRLKATVTVGTRPYLRNEVINFYVVKSVTATNVILGRQFFKKFGTIASTAHGILKLPT